MFKRSLSLLLSVFILLFTFIPVLPAHGEGAAAPAEEAKDGKDISDIVILYTSDVHCGFDKGFTLAGLQQIRDYLTSQGDTVILVDNGDSIQGGPSGTISKGQIPFDLMNKMGYSVAIPGNHEFDYGADRFLELAGEAEFEYISCNITRSGELLFKFVYVFRIGKF